jgi:WD40 repeat protein
MKKILSKNQLLYCIIPLFTVAILGLRHAYVQKYGPKTPSIPQISSVIATPYKPQMVATSYTSKTNAEMVAFDDRNRLFAIRKKSNALITDNYSEFILNIEKYNNVIGEKNHTNYSFSKMEIQNTYFAAKDNMGYGSPISKVAFSSDDKYLIGSNSMQVGIYDISANRWLFKKEIQEGMEYCPLGFLNTKTAVVLLTPLSPTTKQQPLVCFLDIQTGKITSKKELPLPKNAYIEASAWSDAQKQIAVVTLTVPQDADKTNTMPMPMSSPYRVFAFDAKSLNIIKQRVIPQISKQIAFSKEGKRMLIGALSMFGAPCAGYIWDISTDNLEDIPFREQRDTDNILAFSPNGKRVAVGGDRGISVWNADTKQWEVRLDNIVGTPFPVFLPTCSNNGLIHPMPDSNYLYQVHALN